jgi:precorrin-3B C17-methyltransferase
VTGTLTIVGLGPGLPELTTPAVAKALAAATDLVGYDGYLARVPDGPAGQRRHSSDNREEIARARHALTLAAEGWTVTIVSGGDPGVFAMAAAVFEAVETGEAHWRSLDIRVEPGVTAMLAAAAAAGAPLGGDFCAISLSDNLKSWETIARRLEAAAQGDFVIALYNPASHSRPHQLGDAFALLRRWKDANTPVVLARAVGSDQARLTVTTLADRAALQADMRTIVLIGASTTRLIAREGAAPWVYTPRSERAPI